MKLYVPFVTFNQQAQQFIHLHVVIKVILFYIAHWRKAGYRNNEAEFNNGLCSQVEQRVVGRAELREKKRKKDS